MTKYAKTVSRRGDKKKSTIENMLFYGMMKNLWQFSGNNFLPKKRRNITKKI